MRTILAGIEEVKDKLLLIERAAQHAAALGVLTATFCFLEILPD
jgi:hypothetical protein